MKLFIPITKVDVKKRIVYGTAAREERDKSDEIFDYESSKPNFQKWSDSIAKASDGKSLGNVRAMHGKVAAGKLNQIMFDDEAQSIEVAAKIVDDNEWNKVEEGVYTGFSVGGRYEKRWKDGEDATLTRYTADPSEISIVDNPCMPSATFSMIKMDGSEEMREFKKAVPGNEAMVPAITNQAVAARAADLAKAAGDEKAWAKHVDAAREVLEKEAAAAQPKVEETPAVVEKAAEGVEDAPVAVEKDAVEAEKAPDAPELEQVWKAADGQTFETKREALAHNRTLKKVATQPESVTQLLAVIEKADSLYAGADSHQAKGADHGKETSVMWQSDSDLPDYLNLPAAAKPIFRAAANKAKAHGMGEVAIMDEAWGAVRAGWAQTIDGKWSPRTTGDGPEAGPEKAAAAPLVKLDAEQLQKGLNTVSRLASLIDELYWVQQDCTWETRAEDDKSPLPAQLLEGIKSLAEGLKAMVTEECDELIARGSDSMEMAFRPAGFESLVKFLNEKTVEVLGKAGMRHAKKDQTLLNTAFKCMKDLGAEGMKKFAPAEFEKAGARHSKADMEHMNKAHDALESAGAKTADDEAKDEKPVPKATGKAEDSGELAKALAESDSLNKAAAKAIENLMKRVKQLEDTPMPRGVGTADPTLQVVDKGADGAKNVIDDLTKLATENPGALVHDLIKLSQRQPMTRF